ncbi:MAG: PD-(D/E)XK nuclease family protein [Flavobacteriales bacterium]|nr:PD-(D/E)XK nuclease family protein [Flavobacteriales bacterium]
MSLSATEPLDLGWLKDFELPALPKRRQSIFQIARFPDRELVLSNMLAFYLDPEEDHGFGRLFFDSLLDLIQKEAKERHQFHKEALEGSRFEVHREWYTKQQGKKGYIDLVITGTPDDTSSIEREEQYPWAILIENKVHASLYNDLKLYEGALNAEDQLGIVLALKKHPPEDLAEGWIAITHADLIARVRTNLSKYFDQSDDRHLLLLKEFFLNMDRHHMEPDHDAHLRQIQSLRKYHDQITKLEEARSKVNRYIGNTLDAVMENHGFVHNSRQEYTQWRTYYPEEGYYGFTEKETKGIRIWIPAYRILEANVLQAHFELYQEKFTPYGPELRSTLGPGYLESHYMTLGVSGEAGGSFFHLVRLEKQLPDSTPLPEALEQVLRASLFLEGEKMIRQVLATYAKMS